MTDTNYGLIPASTGPKVRVIRLNIGGVDVDAQVITFADAIGNLDIPRRSKMDTTSDPLYIYFGTAPSGSATSAPVWQLERMTVATGDTDLAAAGAFTKAWDNRLTEIYE